MEPHEVYRLSTIPQKRVAAMHAEILATGDVWTRQYEDFQSGGWLTSTLMGASRNPKDILLRQETRD